MIGDHHGWTVRRATLLVTATDEILGTHRMYEVDLETHPEIPGFEDVAVEPFEDWTRV